jgi:hypothetical protein
LFSTQGLKAALPAARERLAVLLERRARTLAAEMYETGCSSRRP